MRALFVELPAFERLRDEYLDDESFRAMQNALIAGFPVWGPADFLSSGPP
jgi:hypothetical protein